MKALTHEMFKKNRKEWFNNRQKGVASVFYNGDKVAFQTGNAIDDKIAIVEAEVVCSDWDRAFGVHSPNGMVYLKIWVKSLGEFTYSWFTADGVLLIN